MVWSCIYGRFRSILKWPFSLALLHSLSLTSISKKFGNDSLISLREMIKKSSLEHFIISMKVKLTSHTILYINRNIYNCQNCQSGENVKIIILETTKTQSFSEIRNIDSFHKLDIYSRDTPQLFSGPNGGRRSKNGNFPYLF